MGKSAIAIIDEAAGEEAVSQTVRLTVIEGSAGATSEVSGAVVVAEVGSAVVAGEAVAGGTVATGIGGVALATAGVGAVVTGLAALGYYLYTRPTDPDSRTLATPRVPPSPETVTPCPMASSVSQIKIATKMTKGVDPKRSGGEIAESDTCPPHAWIVVPGKSGEDPNNAISKLREEAKKRTDESARGYEFEAGAIGENQKYGIDATNREYKCTKCGAIQEVDIVFKDGQLGECKSKNAKQLKNKRVKQQALKYLDIQRQLNESRRTNHKPMAKLDNSERLKNTVDPNGRTAKEIMKKRGYEIELLPPD